MSSLNMAVEATSIRITDSVIQGLAMIAGGANWAKVNMGLFNAYFDASGKEHDQVAVVVAGLVSTAEKWLEWEERWNARLAEEGLEYFHRNELGLMGEYKKERLIEDLSRLIYHYADFKTAVIVYVDHLKNALPKEDREKWKLKAYSLAGRTAVNSVRGWIQGWSGVWPEFIFDQGDDHWGELVHLMESHGYPSPTKKFSRKHIDRKTGLMHLPAVPLQAADLLAYEVFQKAKGAWSGELKTTLEKRLRPDLCKIPGQWGYVEPDRMRFIRDGLEQNDCDILITPIKINTKKGEDSF